MFENEKIPDNPPEEPKEEEPKVEEPAKPNNPSAVKKSSPKVKARTSDTGDHSNTGAVALIGAAALAVVLYAVISSIKRRRL